MKKVRIAVSKETDDMRAEIQVFVDDKHVYSGCFGGEPEDNSIYRDYAWVVPMIENLSVELGALVCTDIVESQQD